MRHWLLKTEPSTFSVEDLERASGQTTCWDGVRNYQARNMLRDAMRRGDRAFLYHSGCKVPGIVGIVEIARAGYPDATAFERRHPHFDPDSDPAAPRWYMVDVRFVRRTKRIIRLDELRAHAHGALAGMALLRAGNRLSVTPVDADHWRFILSLE